jgi:hypothetical protein
MSSLRERVKGGTSRTQQSDSVDAFIAAANEPSAPSGQRPWEGLDKKAVPRTTFNLRLNDYELALLRWLAERREESMQKVAKRTLIPVLEQLVREE